MTMTTAEQPKRAVALKYDEGSGQAPLVVAKGEGSVAEAIIEAAREAGIVIENSPLLAEALAGVEVNDEIPVELYEAVAQIIAYVLKVGAKANR